MKRVAITRVPHLHCGLIAAKVGIALRATALLCLATTLPAARAQAAPCGLTSMHESTQLTYPPIARAAHIQGPVVLLATFQPDGTVSEIKLVSSPLLLDQLMGHVASDYVKGWQANAFSGPRECPLVIDFQLSGPKGVECGPGDNTTAYIIRSERIDLQHVRITAANACVTVTRDPSPKRVHWFLIF